ncbi:MAG: hypothetical protein KAU28_07555, partial [Phycisphaerae bacterium]|nr:hypothetical protein [Phycisphaerae bacterium]
MRDELLVILAQARRRLVRTRALESAAVLAIVAGLCAAVSELAWALAPFAPTVASLIYLLPLVGSIVIALPAARRALRLDGHIAFLAAVFCLAASATGVAFIMTGSYSQVPTAALPLVLMPLGAAIAAAATGIRGVSLREVAILLDMRADLAERLATAVELAETADCDKPYARTVCAQALSAVREKRPQNLPVWNRSRATTGALGLVGLLCLTLALLPAQPPSEPGGELALAVRLDSLSREQRRKLAERFRQAAGGPRTDSELAEKFLQAAAAVEIRDRETLEKTLQKLREAGVELRKVIPPDVLAAAGGDGGGDSIGQADGKSPDAAPPVPPENVRDG